MKQGNVKLFLEEFPIIYNDQEILQEVIDLLSKDLFLCGITDYSFKIGSVDQFIVEVKNFVITYLKNYSEQLRALLYRIDVKETEIVMVFEKSTSDEELANGIIRLMLMRLIQKVLNRRKY